MKLSRFPVILRPLSDKVLRDLFQQACIGCQVDDPYMGMLRVLGRLIEAELQGQVFITIKSRKADAKRRQQRKQVTTYSLAVRRRRLGSPEPLVVQHYVSDIPCLLPQGQTTNEPAVLHPRLYRATRRNIEAFKPAKESS